MLEYGHANFAFVLWSPFAFAVVDALVCGVGLIALWLLFCSVALVSDLLFSLVPFLCSRLLELWLFVGRSSFAFIGADGWDMAWERTW